MLGAVAFFLSAALAVNASATMIDITFTSTDGAGIVGTNSIDASAGDLLTATVSMRADALTGVSSYGISVMFDMDMGSNELDLIMVRELLNFPFAFNFDMGCADTQESTFALVGQVLTCEAATIGAGPPPPVSVDIIELDFRVTANVANGNIDIMTGNFNPGFDGVFDNASLEVMPVYGTASVNLIPEPSTGILVGLGLGGLLVCSRKRSS